jgi:predicted negative regulator of RcsB-dependent stress response
MDDAEALREVGWVAREARELMRVSVDDDPDRWSIYFQRKGDLLSHIGELDMATTAWEEARRIREAFRLAGPIR